MLMLSTKLLLENTNLANFVAFLCTLKHTTESATEEAWSLAIKRYDQ